jgi:hypothetical protein
MVGVGLVVVSCKDAVALAMVSCGCDEVLLLMMMMMARSQKTQRRTHFLYPCVSEESMMPLKGSLAVEREWMKGGLW